MTTRKESRMQVTTLSSEGVSNGGNDSENNTFRYKALDTGKRSFRLLEILPDVETTPIRLRLSPSTFDDDCPTYNALSYSWQCDPPRPQIQTYCNDLPMDIGYNLWAFLHQFRKTGGTGQKLWVDAICIDQKNTSERNHQVAQMRDIYSKASRVIVWLGDDAETDEATEAFSLVVGPSRLLYEDVHRDMRWHRSRRQWRALEKLLNRSYWSRIWIIQEFILGKLAEIHCGNCLAPLENFDDICRWLQDLEKPSTSRHSASAEIMSSKAYRLFKHRTEWWNTDGIARTFSLRKLFEAYASSESSDRRDKVYALLGLACNISNQGHICADYSKTPVEILIDVVRNQCGWATRKDELDNQHLVLLLKEALSVEHDEVHSHVVHYAPDMSPFLHLLTTTKFVRTELLCEGTIVEVGFNQSDQGLTSKRSFGDWYKRPRNWNSFIDPERLSHAATRDIVSELHDLNHDGVLEQDVWDSYGQEQTSSLTRDRFSYMERQPISPPEKLLEDPDIFIATNCMCGITRSPARSGDMICIDPSQPNTRVALILRKFGNANERIQERTVGTAIIFKQEITRATYSWKGDTTCDNLILNQVTGSNQAIYSAKYTHEDFITSEQWKHHVMDTGTMERRFGYRFDGDHHPVRAQRVEFCFRPIYFPSLHSHGFISNAINSPDSDPVLIRQPYPVLTSAPSGSTGPTTGTMAGGRYDPELKQAMRDYERQDLNKRVALTGVRPLRYQDIETGFLSAQAVFQGGGSL